MARNYHENLQPEGLALPANSLEYTRILHQTLNEVPESQKL